MSNRRIENFLYNEPWAITQDWLGKMVSIAKREVDVEALEAKLGKPLDYSYEATQRDRTAIIPIDGPIFPKAGLFSRMSGAVSLDMVAKDFQTALDNDEIDQIVFKINSPGGSVVGIDEMVSLIRGAEKKTYAHVTGLGASAAYWIASATDEISLSPTSEVGSIGVVSIVNKEDGDDTLEFVSSASPRKRLDPETDDGRSAIMEVVDSIAEVFIADVAKGRSTSPEDVKQNYGKGGVLVGQAAVKVGMVDSVRSFEELMASLSEQSTSSYGDYSMNKKELMAKHPDLYQEVLAEGRKEAVQEDSATVEALQAENAQLKADNDDLKKKLEATEAEVQENKKANEEAEARIKALEDKEAIREAQLLQAKADSLAMDLIAASSIPKNLHDRVRACVNHEDFVAEGVFDEKGFVAAVKAEVAEWDKNFQATSVVLNHGDAGAEGENTDTNDVVEQAVDSLFAHVK